MDQRNDDATQQQQHEGRRASRQPIKDGVGGSQSPQHPGAAMLNFRLLEEFPAVPVEASAMLRSPLLQRMIVGCWVLITINTLIFGFVIFLPQFFLRQGLTIGNSLVYTVVLAVASLIGCAIGAWSSDAIGRRWSIIGASIVTIIVGWFYARFNAASDPAIVDRGSKLPGESDAIMVLRNVYVGECI